MILHKFKVLDGLSLEDYIIVVDLVSVTLSWFYANSNIPTNSDSEKNSRKRKWDELSHAFQKRRPSKVVKLTAFFYVVWNHL